MPRDKIALKEDFFEKLLQKKLGGKTFKIIEISVDKKKSEKNFFCSTISQLTVKYCIVESDKNCFTQRENVLDLFIKRELGDGLWLIELQNLDVFTTEITVLSEILPEVERFTNCKIGPTFFYAINQPMTMALEDLSVLGFYVNDRRVGCSKTVMLMAVEKIAKFHAATLFLYEQEPDRFVKYNKHYLSHVKHPNFYKMIVLSLNYISEIIYEWNNESCKKAAAKIKKLATNICDSLRNVMQYDNDELCVLNHGDPWTSNIMIRENDAGEPVEVRMVDYQMCVWTSPVVDLIYFLNLSPDQDNSSEIDNLILDRYLEVFNATIKQLKCKRRSWSMDELKKAMMKRRALIALTAVVIHPRMTSPDEYLPEIDEILEKEHWRLELFRLPKSISLLKKVIPLLDERGYLD